MSAASRGKWPLCPVDESRIALWGRSHITDLHDASCEIRRLQALLAESRQEHLNTETQLNAVNLLLNTPERECFDKGVPLEAAHQVQRWGAQHDAGKQAPDWFWLLGYLAGKALAAHIAGDLDKAKHHCISSGAALRNWHAHIRTGCSVMRPGIAEPKEGEV